MAKLIFYDDVHRYELDGENLPSVSEISRFASREVYGDISQYKLDNACSRGSSVHKSCELLDKYRTCDVSDDIAPYIKAYVEFLKDGGVKEYLYIEKAFASSELKFAGTIDRVVQIDGKTIIVDIKSSSAIQKVLATIQLNAYKILLEENTDLKVDELWILHLQKDGKYKIVKFDIDPTLFMSCLNLHKAFIKKPRGKKNNG